MIFGFLHAALLYFGDFLAAYGLAGMIATAVLLRRGDRVYRVVLWAWGISMVYVAVLSGVAVYQWQWGAGVPGVVAAGAVPSLVASTYVDSAKARLTEWPLHTLTVLPFVMIVWLGMWGARRRLLEDSRAHRRLLQIIAAGGLGIAIVGGLPFAVVGAGWVQTNESAMMAIFLLHQVSGMFAGPGYVALFGLAALWLSGVSPWSASRSIVSAIAALGQTIALGVSLPISGLAADPGAVHPGARREVREPDDHRARRRSGCLAGDGWGRVALRPSRTPGTCGSHSTPAHLWRVTMTS